MRTARDRSALQSPIGIQIYFCIVSQRSKEEKQKPEGFNLRIIYNKRSDESHAISCCVHLMARLDSERDKSREEWWSTPLHIDKQSYRQINNLRIMYNNRSDESYAIICCVHRWHSWILNAMRVEKYGGKHHCITISNLIDF